MRTIPMGSRANQGAPKPDAAVRRQGTKMHTCGNLSNGVGLRRTYNKNSGQ
jgi:hypothetical protein